MEEIIPVILLIRPLLRYILTNKEHRLQSLEELNPIPSNIMTPFGLMPYTGIQRLSLISTLYVDGNGSIGHIYIRSLYLDIIIEKITNGLGIQSQELINSIKSYDRTIIVGAISSNEPTMLYSEPKTALQSLVTEQIPHCKNEFCPCYWYISKDIEIIDNMKHLEDTTERCIELNSNSLPANYIGIWKTNFLEPLVSRIKSSLVDKDNNPQG